MKSLILLAFCLLQVAVAFLPTSDLIGKSHSAAALFAEDPTIPSLSPLVETFDAPTILPVMTAAVAATSSTTSSSSSSPPAPRKVVGLVSTVLAPRRRVGFVLSKIATFITGLGGFVAEGMAADELELAELPPPYIPAIFGVVLLAGVGILTSSLGDVMDEEASLGLQSGARAKKEIERSRSSYFGKRN